MRNLLIAWLFYLVLLSGVAIADDNSGIITIYVQNMALSPNHVQVRDNVCRWVIPKECDFAEVIVQNCTRDRKKEGTPNEKREFVKDCDEAKSTLKSAKCIESLIYDGLLKSKEKVRLSICEKGYGWGEISVRAVNNTSIWTRKFWVRDGDIVDHQ
jgi:hypothetical protein